MSFGPQRPQLDTEFRPLDTTHLDSFKNLLIFNPSQVDRICILIAIYKLSQRYHIKVPILSSCMYKL